MKGCCTTTCSTLLLLLLRWLDHQSKLYLGAAAFSVFFCQTAIVL